MLGLLCSVSLLGALIIRLICLKQTDLKILIAYSSIVHIGMAVGGMVRQFNVGYRGSIYIILGHGFCSSSLFYLLNSKYERGRSRSFFFNKGSGLASSIFGLW